MESLPSPTGDTNEPARSRSEFTATVMDAAGRDWAAREAALQLTARHPGTNWLPADISGELSLPQRARTRWATSDWTRVTFSGALPSRLHWKLGDTNLAWPGRLGGLAFHLEGAATNLTVPRAVVAGASMTADWREGVATVRGDAAMFGGDGSVAVSLDTRAQALQFAVTNRLRPRALLPWLPTNAQPWISSLELDNPALIEGRGRMDWPADAPRGSNWFGPAAASLAAEGRLRTGPGAWRAVTFDRVEAPFTVTNGVWHTDALTFARPEGAVVARLTADARTAEFHGRLASGIDLTCLRPVLPGRTVRDAFRIIEMRVPPRLEATFRGNWRDWNRLGLDALVRGTNFSIHDQPALDCAGRVLYTNQFISILDAEVRREGGELGRAEGIGIDLRVQRLYLTNATGRLDPQAVARAVGPLPGKFLEPYRFDSPPAARAWGTIPLRLRDRAEDMHFEVDGGPFHWRQFHLDRVRGRVDWVKNTLALTNATGEMEGAPLSGGAWFEFLPEGGSAFAFHLALSNAPLKSLASGLAGGRTNRLEGAMAGELTITRAYDRDLKSWQGRGHVQLRNGLIWDIPLFGVFSPVLNAVIPGLGNSRARTAAASFIITNSVIHTAGLEINATGMRMNYEGSVDFDQRVDGRMEAELLRNVPAIGVVISKLFWPVTKLFEYRVIGTLNQPKTEPLFIVPKLLLLPLTPFKSLKELFGEDGRTPPPAKPPEGKAE
jgi:hypothetical protein